MPYSTMFPVAVKDPSKQRSFLSTTNSLSFMSSNGISVKHEGHLSKVEQEEGDMSSESDESSNGLQSPK